MNLSEWCELRSVSNVNHISRHVFLCKSVFKMLYIYKRGEAIFIVKLEGETKSVVSFRLFYCQIKLSIYAVRALFQTN